MHDQREEVNSDVQLRLPLQDSTEILARGSIARAKARTLTGKVVMMQRQDVPRRIGFLA